MIERAAKPRVEPTLVAVEQMLTDVAASLNVAGAIHLNPMRVRGRAGPSHACMIFNDESSSALGFRGLEADVAVTSGAVETLAL